MSNTITVDFIPCTPAPANGYNLQWRVLGSGDPYTDEGNFSSSPAIFTDAINPAGTCYEVVMQSDCVESGESGSVLGNQVFGQSVCEESGVFAHTLRLLSPCNGIPSTFVIENGVAGDIIKVRATFIGLIQRIGGNFTRADLYISSFDGLPDIDGSACYTDTAPHNFSISAETTVTLVSDVSYIYTAAATHNSSSSASNLSVAIIEINGTAVNISASGCAGNSATGGTC